MPRHTNYGNISVPVGTYTKDNEEKKRWRNVGTLMATLDDAPGSKERFWIKLNADCLHASLFALVYRSGMEAGDDQIIAPVFEPKVKEVPAGEYASASDIPF